MQPDILNARIALAKGWTWHITPLPGELGDSHWIDPEGFVLPLLDWVGTLKGVAELMRELNEWAKRRWVSWTWNPTTKFYHAQTAGDDFISEPDCPGDCVGRAYLSAFGKEGDG